jgi:AraC-like DNA-binding protein
MIGDVTYRLSILAIFTGLIGGGAALFIYVRHILWKTPGHLKNLMHRKQKSNDAGSITTDLNVDARNAGIMLRVYKLFEEDNCYVGTDFTLPKLAQRIGYSSCRLSTAINAVEHKNFNAFINEYRVREAMRLLSDVTNDKYGLEEIAGRVGFHSRQSFYSAFSRVVGCTPSAYRKKVHIKDAMKKSHRTLEIAGRPEMTP